MVPEERWRHPGVFDVIMIMATKILVSGCLLGQPVRYNGRALTLYSDLLWRAGVRVFAQHDIGKLAAELGE